MARCRYNVAFDLHNMVPGPAASTTIQTIYKTEDGVMLCYGTSAHTVLEDQANVYSPGCIYIKVVAGGSSVIYVNEGTAASPDFDVVSVA